jgi:hypothetical protein
MIFVDIEKAKVIAHDIRRIARAEEFKPLDEVIAKQIPGTTVEEAEAQRQLIRTKYAELQASMDAAQTVDALSSLLPPVK